MSCLSLQPVSLTPAISLLPLFASHSYTSSSPPLLAMALYFFVFILFPHASSYSGGNPLLLSYG
ncbi:hypothetical protein ACLOJK_028765 [Asimina triloba]